jgi:beta-N-acetylhexosaminidase
VLRDGRLLARLAVVSTAVAILGLVGCGSGKPRYSPSGPVATEITPQGSPAPAGTGKSAKPFHASPAAISAADRLPLASQVAQLFLVSVQGTGPGSAVAGLGTTDWGGVVLDSSNFASNSQVAALVRRINRRAHANARAPTLLAATQEGGQQTAFSDLPPQSEATIGSSGRPQLAAQQALLAGRALKHLGIAMTLAPLADVDTPQGALSGRLFSTDPAAVARFTAAALGGYARAGVIAAVGHFPGAGGASADPDQQPATVGGSLAELQARDLIPFASIAAIAPVILMSNAAYAAFDGVTPASLSEQAVTLLRGPYQFQGAIMSDDLDATLEPTGQTPGTVATEALQAGDDLLYITGPASEHAQAYEGVLAQAQRNKSLRARVRDALLRDLTLKARYGLLG